MALRWMRRAARDASGAIESAMVNVRRQIETGRLVCPRSKQRLIIDDLNRTLRTVDRRTCYQYLDGRIPILLVDPELTREYSESSKMLVQEYQPRKVPSKRGYGVGSRLMTTETKLAFPLFTAFLTRSQMMLYASLQEEDRSGKIHDW
jgi:hypothetical protein